MGIIKAQLNQIQESIDVLLDHRPRQNCSAVDSAEEADDSECYKMLPIQNLEQMNQLKDLLSDVSKRRTLVL